MSDRLAVVLWWFIELYSWSRFFLPTNGRTDKGVPRGPRGPKNILVLAASFGASIQIVKHTVHCNAWQSVDSFTFTGSNDRRILTNYIIREEGENSLFKCTICGHVNALKTNVLNHVESIHFPNTFQYSCDICGKTTKSKQSLYKHVSVNHRQGKIASI